MLRKLLRAINLGAGLTPLILTQAFAQTVAPVTLPDVDVIATSPLAGSGESRDKIPGLVQSIPSADFSRANSPNVLDTLQQKVPAAVSIDINGNPFSQDFVYRGFTVSPRQGTPQGLAVYQNGIRLNEPFGDTVNFDLVPPQAIDHADVYTNNPLFGLNALGGALSLTMKNGFTWQGLSMQAMGGSYGRASTMVQFGQQSGDYSLYITGDAERDQGWRTHSPSQIGRLYGDLGYRTPDAELHVLASGAMSSLGVIGPTPIGLAYNDYRSVFTSPQTTQNTAGSLVVTARFPLNPQWTLNSNFYIRAFQQKHVDGNDADLQNCADNASTNDFAGSLCVNDSSFPSVTMGNNFVILNKNGNPIPASDAIYGTIDRTFIHTLTAGTALQASYIDKFFGHDNFLTFGGSIDRSALSFSSVNILANIDSNLVVGDGNFPGSGSIIHTLGGIGYVPTYLTGNTAYYGLYALDTFNITAELALTAGARLNIANILTADTTGSASELNIDTSYSRINPVVGLTYKILPNATAYAGYSEANRAPTPLELDCANPLKPCLLENSLVSDPPLQQVVSHTVEAGLRGNVPVFESGAINWKAGYFRTNNANDIIPLASTITSLGYYTNVPATLRRGVEAGADFHYGDWLAYLNYGFVEATYRFSGTLASPNNPYADSNGNIYVSPGNHIPGIPQHLLKLGAEFAATPQFKLGADVLVVGSQYYIGDESNLNPKLPAYWVANLHASYKITDHFEIFGLINNVFNRKYATYGTFFDTNTNAQAASSINFTYDPRTITAAQPLSVYGGVRVTF